MAFTGKSSVYDDYNVMMYETKKLYDASYIIIFYLTRRYFKSKTNGIELGTGNSHRFVYYIVFTDSCSMIL